jgi:plasmid segregation protein ParM
MPAVVRAIDVGFGHTKFAAAVHGDVIVCAHFPSVAQPSLVDPASRPSLGGRRRTVSIPVGAMFYEVGDEIELAGAFTRPALPIEDYVETEEYLALLRGALAFMKVDHVDLLVLGLPVATYAARKTQLERRAIGQHDVGNRRIVTVAKAIAIAQPQGALVTYAMQHESLEAIKRQESLVIDAVSRTFDWLCARGLRLVANRSGSAPYGVYDITQRIAEAITSKLGVPYEDRDAIDLALRKQKPLRLFGDPHPIERYKPIVESIAKEAVRAMLMSIGGTHRFDNVVLVGGGAFLFKKALREAFPRQRIQEVADPIYANVRGFQRAGMDKMSGQASEASAHAQE